MAESTTLARPYAKAAFQAALAAGELQRWYDMLSLAAAVAADSKVGAALSRPSMTGEERARLLIELCGEEINDGVRSFLGILAENKRLVLLDDIVELFQLFKAEQEKTLDIEVQTAYPLTDETQQQLASSLKGRLQREVKLHSEVDKGLIGGIVIRAGDLVIDGSVRSRLNKLAEAMNS